MKKRSLLIVAWFSLVAIACNLSNSGSRPPTIVPQAVLDATPQPTLGFSTAIPGNASIQVTPVGAVQQSFEIEMFNLMSEVEADRLIVHIDSLVNFHTRHINSVQDSLDKGIGAAYDYLMSQFLSYQAQSAGYFTVVPEGHPFTAWYQNTSTRQRNVVGVLQGTEANGGIIIVGAHYDSRTDDLNDATGFAPGADDNGSGVAAILELARILSKRPQRATIVFVLFSAEEETRQGSIAFVQDFGSSFPTDSTVMLNLDTIGSNNDGRGVINDYEMRLFSPPPNDSPSRQLARTIDFIAFNYDLDLDLVLQDALDREGRYGDQQSFAEAGYPAVRFVEAVEDHYNREGRDTLDGVEPYYLAASTRTVLGVIVGLAGGPRPPRNMALRDESGGMKSLVWETVPDAATYIVALRVSNSLDFSQQFTVIEPRTAPWDGFGRYEAVYVAAVDAAGKIGPLSSEYKIR